MSKLVLFIGILSTLYLCYVHKRIKLRTIGITMIAFVIIALLFTQTRATSSGDTDDTFTFAELLAMYLLSPIPAFGLENPCSSPIWGYETFRPVYNILSGLGLYHGDFFDLGRVIRSRTYSDQRVHHHVALLQRLRSARNCRIRSH